MKTAIVTVIVSGMVALVEVTVIVIVGASGGMRWEVTAAAKIYSPAVFLPFNFMTAEP